MALSLAAILSSWPQISGLRFLDADDALRYVQVQDWISGQSWWDVYQHRLAGGDLHWSRLVDLPVALLILIFRFLVGEALADRIASTAVPLLTLLCAMLITTATTFRLAGIGPARLAVAVMCVAPPILLQTWPLRIDHHGWQMVFAAGAFWGLYARRDVTGGVLAGLSLAAYLTISLEGLPVAAALVGVAALRWAFTGQRKDPWASASSALAIAAILLHLMTRGPSFWTAVCDAMAPAWLAALAAAGLGAWVTSRLQLNTVPYRLGSLTLIGVAAGAPIGLFAPQCLAGPFGMLPPLVREFWYENVLEGLPIWKQSATVAALMIGTPVAGCVAAVIAAWRAKESDREQWRWIALVLMLLLVLAALVLRSGSTVTLLAVPAAAWGGYQLLKRARAIQFTPVRIAATLAALSAPLPGVPAAMATKPQTAESRTADRSVESERGDCPVASLRNLPLSTVFAPLDVTPDLLAKTPHRAIASGHHRNFMMMERVITAFTLPPGQAFKVVEGLNADFIILCPDQGEIARYVKSAPHGLASRLVAGGQVEWLQAVHSPAKGLHIWRIKRLSSPLPDRSAQQ